MFKMVNRYGNAVCIAKSESERDEFIKRGFTEEKQEPKPKKVEKAEKKEA